MLFNQTTFNVVPLNGVNTQILAASGSCASTSSGSLGVIVRAASSVAAVSTTTGAVANSAPLAVSAAAVSTTTGAVAHTVPLALSITAVSTSTGAVTKSTNLASTAAAVSTLAGSVIVDWKIASAATSRATATGNLVDLIGLQVLAGTGAISNVANAPLGLIKNLFGNPQASSDASGSLIFTYLNDINHSTGSTVELLSPYPTAGVVSYSAAYANVTDKGEIFAEVVSVNTPSVMTIGDISYTPIYAYVIDSGQITPAAEVINGIMLQEAA